MNTKTVLRSAIKNLFTTQSFFSRLFVAVSSFAQAQTTLVNTTVSVGKIEGVAIELKVQGPAAQATPFQIACVFEYTEGEITNPPALPRDLNGIVHFDSSFQGLITDLRKSGRFARHQLETLLINPPPNFIPAKNYC